MRVVMIWLFVFLAGGLFAAAQDSTAGPGTNAPRILDSAKIKAPAKEVTTNKDTVGSVISERIENADAERGIIKLISTGKIVWTLVVLLITYFAIKIVIKILRLISERSARYRITVKGLIPLVRILGWTVVLTFVVVGIFRPSDTTLIAFSASVGVAVGFAAQDILKNIFGGIVIIFDQPFRVGDKIEIGNYYGEVIEIGLRSTRIITPDDSMVSVPNAEIMNQSVSNANAGETNCQVVAEVYLPVGIDTRKVRQLAVEVAQVSKYVYLKKPVQVVFSQEIKDNRSYMKMRLKAYVVDIRFEFAFKSDMTEQVIGHLIREGILPESF